VIIVSIQCDKPVTNNHIFAPTGLSVL